jgi:hypothetical protein
MKTNNSTLSEQLQNPIEYKSSHSVYNESIYIKLTAQDEFLV